MLNSRSRFGFAAGNCFSKRGIAGGLVSHHQAFLQKFKEFFNISINLI